MRSKRLVCIIHFVSYILESMDRKNSFLNYARYLCQHTIFSPIKVIRKANKLEDESRNRSSESQAIKLLILGIRRKF